MSAPASPLILALGSINVDFEVRVERLPQPSETLIGRDLLMAGGGKAANVAVVACRLGIAARLLAHVGDDTLAETALALLRSLGVDLSATRRVAKQLTGVSQIWVGPDGEQVIVLAPNANDAWTRDDAQRVGEAISTAPRGSVLTVDCEVPDFIVRAALDAARRAGQPIVLDPSPAERVPADLDGVAFVTPNPSEAGQLTGIEVRSPADAERAGRALVERGAGGAVVKLSGGGCVVVTRALSRHLAAPPVAVVDTTGAGDAFAGGLAVAILEGQDPVAAARFATAVASITVGRYGSQPAYPSRQEVEQLLLASDA